VDQWHLQADTSGQNHADGDDNCQQNPVLKEGQDHNQRQRDIGNNGSAGGNSSIQVSHVWQDCDHTQQPRHEQRGEDLPVDCLEHLNDRHPGGLTRCVSAAGDSPASAQAKRLP